MVKGNLSRNGVTRNDDQRTHGVEGDPNHWYYVTPTVYCLEEP